MRPGTLTQLLKISLIVVVAIAVAGCASRGASSISEDGPGFFLGVWHGMIAPFAFIGHIFDDSIAVYASPNSGGWYDFGFLLGVGALSSGTTNAASR